MRKVTITPLTFVASENSHIKSYTRQKLLSFMLLRHLLMTASFSLLNIIYCSFFLVREISSRSIAHKKKCWLERKTSHWKLNWQKQWADFATWGVCSLIGELIFEGFSRWHKKSQMSHAKKKWKFIDIICECKMIAVWLTVTSHCHCLPSTVKESFLKAAFVM